MSVKHSTLGGVAGAIMAVGANQALPPKVVEKPVAVTVAASRFAWPDLSDAEAAALGVRLKWLAGVKVQVFCDGADCRDLQTSLDNALEDAGVSSERSLPTNALGYGIKIFYGVGEHDRAFRMANDIAEATGGRLNPRIDLGVYVKDDELRIALGKKPRG